MNRTLVALLLAVGASMSVVPDDGALALDAHSLHGAWAATGPQAQRDTVVPISAGGLVEIRVPTGRVLVQSWNRNEVRVRGGATGLGAGFTVSSTPSVVRVGSMGGRRGDASLLEVWVPASARLLTRVSTGDIRISGVSGDIEVEASAGDVTLNEMGGSIALNVSSGDLLITDARGPISGTVLSGDVEITRAAGTIHIESVAGRVRMREINSSNVEVKAVSGDITFEGPLANAGVYRFESFSSSIRMRIPPTSSALFSLETLSGEIRTEMQMTLESSVGGDLAGALRRNLRLGSGSARVTARTFSGGISIERGG